MNCDELRQVYLVDPKEVDAEGRAHLAGCSACQAFVQECAALDAVLQSAIRVPVPTDLKSKLQAPQAETVRRTPVLWGGFALAASITLAVILVVFDSAGPAPSLDRLVYEHVGHETLSLVKHDVSPAHIESEFQRFGLKMKVPGAVRFVERCPIGDTYGLHLVFENQDHRITFIYLPEIDVDAPLDFAYGSLHGIIRPAPKGSMAVVGDDDLNLHQTESVVERGIEWL